MITKQAQYIALVRWATSRKDSLIITIPQPIAKHLTLNAGDNIAVWLKTV